VLHEIAILNYESRNIIAKEKSRGNDPNRTERALENAEVEVEKKANAKAGWSKTPNKNKRKKAKR